MNILILNWRDPKNQKSGGAEIVTIEHAKAWVRQGHGVTWFTSQFPGGKQEETHEGIAFVRRGNEITNLFFAFIYYLRNKDRFDIVIDEIHGLPYFTPFYVRKPKIAFIHEVAGVIWDYMYPFPISRLGKILESMYLRFYKNTPFWTDANSTNDELVTRGIKRSNCTAIACPTHLKALVELPEKEKNPTFIFVSRLVKMKGIEDVLSAFADIKLEKQYAKLWIVGTGDENYLEALKKRAYALGISESVTFFGRVDEKEKVTLMQKAHILLHASVKEGWGLVVIEAASQATPSVTYDVTGLRDTVRHNTTGILTKENIPAALAQEAVSLLNDEERYKEYQKNGLKWAKSLTWVDATKKSLTLLAVHADMKRHV